MGDIQDRVSICKSSLGMETRNCDYVTRPSVTNHINMSFGIRHENLGYQGKFGLVVVPLEVNDVNDPWGVI